MINRLKDQHGAAIILVLALVVIAGILGFAAISVAENQTVMVTRHQQREMALHYAEAGVHRYMAELNNDLDFYDTQASTNMQNVDTAFEDGYYRLQVINPSTSSPYITVQSTGWHKNSDIKRTVETQLHKKTYLSNIITANVGESRVEYFNRFIRGDVINGPLHINGDLIVNGHTGEGYTGPIFNDTVTYSGTFTRETNPVTASDTTQFNEGDPVHVNRMGMPATNESLEAKTDSGYVYTGRTFIYINGSTLKIRNQASSTIETKALPSHGIIYVKGGVGDKWSLDTANVFVSGHLDGRLTIAAQNNIYITAFDPTNWNRPKGSVTSPMANSGTGGITYDGLNMAGVSDKASLSAALASCDDMLGLIANKNVEILHFNWPKQTSDSPSYYWKSWDSSGYSAGSEFFGTAYKDVAPYNMNIHASIYAVTGSFEYERHLEGTKKGLLTVVGSINQYEIGPVCGFGSNIVDLTILPDPLHERITGYGKYYWHDPRLMYDAPPEFLEPTNTGWEIIEWREVSNPVTTP